MPAHCSCVAASSGWWAACLFGGGATPAICAIQYQAGAAALPRRRCFEDVELAAEPGGPLGQGGAFPLTRDQRFSLGHRGDLLEVASEAQRGGSRPSRGSRPGRSPPEAEAHPRLRCRAAAGRGCWPLPGRAGSLGRMLHGTGRYGTVCCGAVPGEVREMLVAVQQGLEAVSHPGWRVELVGGGRRSAAAHDAGLGPRAASTAPWGHRWAARARGTAGHW